MGRTDNRSPLTKTIMITSIVLLLWDKLKTATFEKKILSVIFLVLLVFCLYISISIDLELLRLIKQL